MVCYATTDIAPYTSALIMGRRTQEERPELNFKRPAHELHSGGTRRANQVDYTEKIDISDNIDARDLTVG